MRYWVLIGLLVFIIPLSGCVTGAVIQEAPDEYDDFDAVTAAEASAPSVPPAVPATPSASLPVSPTPTECPDMAAPCPDGTTALCRNFFVNGRCTTCTPSCPAPPAQPIQQTAPSATSSPSPPSSPSPSPAPSSSPSPTPSPTPSPSPPPTFFNITFIQYDPPGSDTGKYDQEWIQVTGHGALANYTLSDNLSSLYIFPDFFLDGTVTLHSSAGVDNTTDLFWGKNRFIWNNDGDMATLRDPAGTIASVYVY